jgi:hypothetical protein
MAPSWREIHKFQKDPAGAANLATRLLKLPRSEFTDWEVDFLQSMVRQHTVNKDNELSTRQAEKLLQIRDDIEEVEEVAGFSVELLLKGCHDARLDLTEGDEAWIAARLGTSQRRIRRKFAGRLMRCARGVNIIDQEYSREPV